MTTQRTLHAAEFRTLEAQLADRLGARYTVVADPHGAYLQVQLTGGLALAQLDRDRGLYDLGGYSRLGRPELVLRAHGRQWRSRLIQHTLALVVHPDRRYTLCRSCRHQRGPRGAFSDWTCNHCTGAAQ